jgi:molybdate transport system substrate-binding protein
VIRRAFGALVVSVLVAGCIGFTGDPTSRPASAPPTTATATPEASTTPVELTIFAAASLKRVLDKVKAAYEVANPGTTLTISTDSSTALRTKIEQGAPADVFLSADTTNVAALVDGGFAPDDISYFAGAWLTIAVPSGNPGGVTSPFDLARPGLRIIAAGDAVPISGYAARLVEDLAAEPGAPAGFAGAYAANVVSREDNVSAVVAKIALGEGDAAIVYEPDATGVAGVATVNLTLSNIDAIYAGVVLKAAAHAAEANAFMSWLTSRAGGAILVDAGFFIPPA